MDSRLLWTSLTWAACALGAACVEEGPAPQVNGVCALPCNDGDPCTDDLCDPNSGACLSVPRGVQLACRTDQHCDDGEACTIDTCAVDDCGLERCTSAIAAGCQGCRIDDDCADDNGCTVDRCEVRDTTSTTPGSAESIFGFCANEVAPGCDPRCDPHYDPGPDLVREVGRIDSRCAGACPCEGPLVMSNPEARDAGELVLALDGASCTTTRCEPDAGWDCAPLVSGPTYTVWGAPLDGGIAVEGYCMAGVHLLSTGAYAGQLDVAGAGTASFRAHVSVDGHPSIAVTPEPCDGCALEIVSRRAEYGIVEGQAHVFEIVVVDRGTKSTVRARLHATPTGAAGAITSDVSGVTGTLRLDWVPSVEF